MAIDPNSLPRDSETLRKIVVDLAEQLDRSLAEQNKYQSLLRELLEAQHNRKSEQLSKEQLVLLCYKVLIGREINLAGGIVKMG